MKITVTIPGDVTKELAPNRRYHWGAQRAASAIAKRNGYFYTLEALQETGAQFHPPVKLTCTRHYTGRAQPFDFDNLPVTFKAFIDGIKSALGQDDNNKEMVMEFRQVRGDVAQLVFEIEQLREWTEAQAGTVRVIGGGM